MKSVIDNDNDNDGDDDDDEYTEVGCLSLSLRSNKKKRVNTDQTLMIRQQISQPFVWTDWQLSFLQKHNEKIITALEMFGGCYKVCVSSWKDAFCLYKVQLRLFKQKNKMRTQKNVWVFVKGFTDLQSSCCTKHFQAASPREGSSVFGRRWGRPEFADARQWLWRNLSHNLLAATNRQQQQQPLPLLLMSSGWLPLSVHFRCWRLISFGQRRQWPPAVRRCFSGECWCSPRRHFDGGRHLQVLLLMPMMLMVGFVVSVAENPNRRLLQQPQIFWPLSPPDYPLDWDLEEKWKRKKNWLLDWPVHWLPAHNACHWQTV